MPRSHRAAPGARLPRRVDRITTALERGTLTTGVRLLADDRDRQFVASMAGRAVLAFLGAAFGVMSVMLIGVRGGSLFFPAAAGVGGTSLFHVFGYAGLFRVQIPPSPPLTCKDVGLRSRQAGASFVPGLICWSQL